jgi:transposase
MSFRKPHTTGHGGRRNNAGRSVIDLSMAKDKIIDLFHQGLNNRQIAKEVKSTESTVKRRLEEWGLRRRKPRSLRADIYLNSQVAIMFMSGFTDEEIVLALNSERTGANCVHHRLVENIRKSQGLVRRMSAWARQEANKVLWDVIQAELDSGKIEGYGKGLLYTHFKALGCQVSRYIPTLFYILYLLAIILYIKSNII